MRAFRPWLAAFSLALSLWSPLSGAQATFSAPACDPTKADSTCFSAPGSLSCIDQPRQEMRACPAPYVGQGLVPGTLNSCTGSETWNDAAQDKSACTTCPTPLSDDNVEAIQNAILGAHEDTNVKFFFYACTGCLDGTAVVNPSTGLLAGRSFREHVYVTDPWPTGDMPAVPRVNYLATQGSLPPALPEVPGIAILDPATGFPMTETHSIYEYLNATTGAYPSTRYPVPAPGDEYVTGCVGNDSDHCEFSCNPPLAGFYSPLCETLQVAFNPSGCSDSWEVQSGGSWVPTRSLTAPYTASLDYASKEWDWETVRSWNGIPASNTASAAVYACASTVNTCTGWVTDSSAPACVSSHVETNPVTGATYTICDEYSTLLSQSNDCTGSTRSIFASNIPNTCSGYVASTISCPGDMTHNAATKQCECAAGTAWDGASCASLSGSGSVCPAGFSATVPGAYLWTVPDGVSSISAMAVGGGAAGVAPAGASKGAGGGGGGTGWRNSIPVTPGSQIRVFIGGGGQTSGANGGDSYIQLPDDSIPVRGNGGKGASCGAACGWGWTWPGGTFVGAGGGAGGGGSRSYAASGGAGGYLGAGGSASWWFGAAGGGGGAGYVSWASPATPAAGGGVGLFGLGYSGANGTAASIHGQGGSSGDSGSAASGGNYGGGGPLGGAGSVRIVYSPAAGLPDYPALSYPIDPPCDIIIDNIAPSVNLPDLSLYKTTVYAGTASTTYAQWSRDARTKAIIVLVQGGGGYGGPTADGGLYGGGGGAGGYSYKAMAFAKATSGTLSDLYSKLPAPYLPSSIPAGSPSLSARNVINLIAGGIAGTSYFGSSIWATGGAMGGTAADGPDCRPIYGAGGTAAGGDINLNGIQGGYIPQCTAPTGPIQAVNRGKGAPSLFYPTWMPWNTPAPLTAYGAGGGGTGWESYLPSGSPGAVIVFEFE